MSVYGDGALTFFDAYSFALCDLKRSIEIFGVDHSVTQRDAEVLCKVVSINPHARYETDGKKMYEWQKMIDDVENGTLKP